MRVRLHTGLPAEIPAGMFVLSGRTLLTACDGIGIEFTAMTADELRHFAALLSSIADESERSAPSEAALVLASVAAMGNA